MGSAAFEFEPEDLAEDPKAQSGLQRLDAPSELAANYFLDLVRKKRDADSYGRAVTWLRTASKQEVSTQIDRLKSESNQPQIRPIADAAERQAGESAAAVTDGMYRRPADGVIFKVQIAVHGSGQLYAKRLIVDQHEGIQARVRFEYAPGEVRRLRPEWRMTLAEAKEFGALYGTCAYCGRTLTREESIERGIGPVCAGKFL